VLTLPAEPVVVHGDGLALREYRPDDLERLLAAFGDSDLEAWNPGPGDADGAREWMQRRNDWTSGEHASWAVTDGSGVLLGSVSLHHLDLEQGDSEIGYWTSPDARGRGVAVGAVRLAVAWAFGDLGLHRVHLYHAVENPPSCRVATAAGFRHEGVLRESYRYSDGAYRDEHLHAILASEWREMIAR
jgi:RimJ/RimL family protein N-acetyltransferase